MSSCSSSVISSSFSLILALPDDVSRQVVGFLGFSGQGALSKTCRKCNSLVKSN